MKILYRVRALVRWLFRRDEIERALDTDLNDYIERSAAEKVRAGMTEAEARRAVRIELGGVEQTKDRVRKTLSFAPLDKALALTEHQLANPEKSSPLDRSDLLATRAYILIDLKETARAEEACARLKEHQANGGPGGSLPHFDWSFIRDVLDGKATAPR